MGLILCFLAFVTAFLRTQRSLGGGMVVVLVVGYAYGLARAVIFDGPSYFLFDAAVLGVYAAYFMRPDALQPAPHQRATFRWVSVLIVWPVVVFGLCLCFPQHPLVQLVGLRAAVWFLPFLLLGAAARPADLVAVTRALAFLNLAALAVALAEYRLGLEAFLPHNAATDLIYQSNDIGNYEFYRIPSTFISSAAYGGVMVASLPLLAGRWVMPGVGMSEKALLTAALLAAATGTFLCGSRTPVLMLFLLAAVAVFSLRSRLGYVLGTLAVGAVVAYVVTGNVRLQRFTTLEDTDYIVERLGHSMNLGILDLLTEYPLGAGLGSAFGTSIPSFLRHLAPEPIGVENEFARIGLEQSVVGALLWLGFVGWVLTRRHSTLAPTWFLSARLVWVYLLMCWVSAFFGCGLLAAVPGTVMMLFQMGWLTRLHSSEAAADVPRWPERLAGRPPPALVHAARIMNGKA